MMMRRLVAIAVLALATPAGADEIGVGMFGNWTHLGGIQAGGLGVEGEFARRLDHVQVFGEAAVAWLAVGVLTAPQSGIQGRLGVGVRWIARQWGTRRYGFDLYIDGGAGESGYAWAGNRVTRPDVNLGWGYQIRAPFWGHRLTLRSGLRALLVHDRNEPAYACRGCIVSRPQTIDGGMLFVMEMSW